VWGSWYDIASNTWGYACCHSVVHISYCTGEAGRQATAASSAQNLLLSNSSQPKDPTSKPPAGGDGDKGKQRTDIDVEEAQSKLSEERKRKARVNDGDNRFNKKSKAEEGLESKKFDVTEGELGTELVRINTSDVRSNKWLQRDTVVKGIGWKIQWRTTWMMQTLDLQY
jgi:pre-mRNA-processing factor SLU7